MQRDRRRCSATGPVQMRFLSGDHLDTVMAKGTNLLKLALEKTGFKV